jgi:hypothetical protein
MDVSSPGNVGILFLSHSFSGYYDTRVKQIHQTWGKRINDSPDMHLIIVTNSSNVTPRRGEDVRGTKCVEGYKDLPECCKRGEIFKIAHQYFSSEAGKAMDWAVFIDDDVFVIPEVLSRYIQQLGPEALDTYKLYGIPMGTSKCGGVWGGTGFIMNRKTLELVIHGTRPGFETITEEILDMCMYCGGWGDIATSFLLLSKRNGQISASTAIHGQQRAFMYNMTRDEMETALRPGANKQVPWLFHHSSRDNVLWLDERVAHYDILSNFYGFN